MWKIVIVTLWICCLAVSTGMAGAKGAEMTDQSNPSKATPSSETEVATLAGGCFWCLEAVFEELEGVKRVLSGYAGGNVKNPSYQDVCSGTTGHAEVVRVEFDSEVIGYAELLDVFFAIHDPTTMNRQGADMGSQYRSAIFYHDERQKQIADDKIIEIDSSKRFGRPVVTQLEAAAVFYEAEDYHQDYFKLNPEAGYCRAVIEPKMFKFRDLYGDKLK